MYTTLIVDDEQLMRQYLGDNLSTICPYFSVTGIACDGLEALELLKKQSFDLVITDIKMPEMDGINLSKYIFESELNTKVIIISGYNEFEYARMALKYGVSDYLLKPLSDASIHETLTKMKDVLDLDASKKNSHTTSNSYDNYSVQEVQSALLSAIIGGVSNSIQLLYSILQSRRIPFLHSYSAIMLLSLDDLYLLLYDKTPSENTSYKYDLNQHCKTHCSLHGLTTAYDDYGNTIVLLSADTETELIATANSIYQEMNCSYREYDKIKVISSYGSIEKDMMSLLASYSSALESLTLTLANVPSPISSNYYISQSRFLNEIKTIREAIYSDYISKNSNKMHSDLYLYLMLFHETITINAILKFGTYLIRFLSRKCNIKPEYTIASFKELTNSIDQLISIKILDKENTHALFMRALQVLDHEDIFTIIPETTNTVESAKEYICTHYQDQISLAQVADVLNVNPSYLSDLFHKSIGEPYSKFLTRVRMEQALLLLKSNPNEKIYKIAEKTGFVSAKHFNSVFKKFYGLTPTEYIYKNMR